MIEVSQQLATLIAAVVAAFSSIVALGVSSWNLRSLERIKHKSNSNRFVADKLFEVLHESTKLFGVRVHNDERGPPSIRSLFHDNESLWNICSIFLASIDKERLKIMKENFTKTFPVTTDDELRAAMAHVNGVREELWKLMAAEIDHRLSAAE